MNLNFLNVLRSPKSAEKQQSKTSELSSPLKTISPTGMSTTSSSSASTTKQKKKGKF